MDIRLSEVATLTPTGTTFGERVADAFAGGWHGFVAFLQGFVLAVIYLWPVLLVVGIIAAVAISRHPDEAPPQESSQTGETGSACKARRVHPAIDQRRTETQILTHKGSTLLWGRTLFAPTCSTR